MPTVTLSLSDTAYPLYVENGELDRTGLNMLENGIRPETKLAIISDETVSPLYADRLMRALHQAGYAHITLLTVPAGEKSKSLTQVEALCDSLARAGIDRKGMLIALGGGVIGDLTGFVAAIHYRGIPFIQIPTTILSQVDSSIGGKTGVNLPSGKNLVGAFHHPKLVIIDPETLQSLPPRVFIEGLAEVIKHAAIRDSAMLEVLAHYAKALQQQDFSQLHALLPELIARNVAIKARVVEADEKELLDIRALLNFGHTLGHGIEAAVPYGCLLHGECVSLGMRAVLEISVGKGTLTRSDADFFLDLMEKLGLPIQLNTSIEPQRVIERMMADKKFAAGQIRVVLLKGLGDAYVSEEVTLDELKKALMCLYSPR